MKINRDTFLIKAHYFFFFAGLVPVLPYFIVLGVDLGVPIALQSALGSLIMVITIFAKPSLSVLVDAFPVLRRAMFVTVIFVCGLSYSTLAFVKPFGQKPYFENVFVVPKLFALENHNSTDGFDFNLRSESLILNQTDLLLKNHDVCILVRGLDCKLSTNQSAMFQLMSNGRKNLGYSSYNVTGNAYSMLQTGKYESLDCEAGVWSGDCQDGKVWQTGGFWAFAILLTIGTVTFSTANSISDAITVDTIGVDGNYGLQRAWGSLGWGLMGPVSGLLVDYWSGESEVKDYTPAFMMVFVIMGFDVILSANLKVPEIKVSEKIWSNVWPLLRQPRFFLFLCFSVLNGCFDAAILNFIFILQEDMATGTPNMQSLKFIQGMTLFVQCATEVPCMFSSDWLVKRIGAERVTSLVFTLFSLRFFLITCVGTYGTVWMTVAVELLNGPCYGLGYAAIVVYAGQLAPTGASTTVQSITNVCFECVGYAVSTVLSGLVVASLDSTRLFLVWGIIAVVTLILHSLYVRCVPPMKEKYFNKNSVRKANNLPSDPLSLEEEDKCLPEPTEENTVTINDDEEEPVDADTLSEVSDNSSNYNEHLNKSLDNYLKNSLTTVSGRVSDRKLRH